MTTYISPLMNYSNRVQADDFQESWIQQFHNAFVGAGLVQTSDTGQQTIPVPAGSIGVVGSPSLLFGGYLIYRFNDAAQATKPLFFRVDFSTGNNNGGTWQITVRIRLGTGSDGSGTITGIFADTEGTNPGFNYTTTVSGMYACHTEGFFGLWCGSSAQCTHFFVIERSRDPSTGSFDDKRTILMWGPDGQVANSHTCRLIAWQSTSPTYLQEVTTAFCFVPGLPASTSLSNGDKQLYPCWYLTPEQIPMWSVFACRTNEFGPGGVTFSATPVVNLKTYITFAAASARINITQNSNFTGAMLWE